MKHYAYVGPVMEFERCIAHEWKGETFAQTERKAKSNLAYQFKQNTGKANNAKISLPGGLKIIDDVKGNSYGRL